MSRARTLHPAAVTRLRRVYLAGAPGAGDPRHGTDAGYAAGCKCGRCLQAHSRRTQEHKAKMRPLADATGTHRRLQALACLGYSWADLSRRMGRDRSYVGKLVRYSKVQVETGLIVAALYDTLSMTPRTGPGAARTAREARARGWVPPLAWDRIDDPQARPRSGSAVPDVDLDVLGWITLEGRWEYARGADAPLRDAVRAWWATTGRPWAELERLTGWNIARDQRRCPLDMTAVAS